MNPCLQEGDWRAYLDGELTDAEMSAAAEHLAECADCRELHREVSERASRVGSWMMDLDAAAVPSAKPARSAAAWKWAAAVAFAAAVAAAFILAPSRVRTVQAPAIAQAQPPLVMAPAPPPAEVSPTARHASRRAVLPRRAPKPQYFLALDEEPIETGTVMRVAFESGGEADVIVDQEGRPRAIRPVTNSKEKME